MVTNNVSIDLLSVAEAGKVLGYSRQHVLRLINAGEIPAQKIGRSFVIRRESLGGVYKTITGAEKTQIDRAVSKIVREYGDTLRRLGKE
jgi:excisionase family DNA binding protein